MHVLACALGDLLFICTKSSTFSTIQALFPVRLMQTVIENIALKIVTKDSTFIHLPKFILNKPYFCPNVFEKVKDSEYTSYKSAYVRLLVGSYVKFVAVSRCNSGQFSGRGGRPDDHYSNHAAVQPPCEGSVHR